VGLDAGGQLPVERRSGASVVKRSKARSGFATTAQCARRAIRILSEPVYVQTDVLPTIAADAPNESQGSCRVEVREFLVDKP
jgi:hypothetical protein